MQLDVLSLITPDPTWAKSNGLNMGDHTMWTYVDSTKLVYIKGPNGSPWDWYTFDPSDIADDQERINLLMTENVWSNPATAKIQLANGVPRYPRWIDYSLNQSAPASVSFSLIPPRTNYIIINADGTVGHNSNGNVVCSFYGPVPSPDIKDPSGKVIIPAGVDWISDYSRSGALERLRHRAPVGRYSWEQFDSSGNLTAHSYPVGITAMPCPTPVQKIF